MKIRQARIETLGMRPDSDYGDLRQIRREINHAKRVFQEHPDWTLVDMSRKAVEEAASSIIETYRWRFDARATTAVTSPGNIPPVMSFRGGHPIVIPWMSPLVLTLA